MPTISFIKNILPEDSTFKIVYIDIVHDCNMECSNCYLPNRDYPDVPAESVYNFIDKFTVRTEFRLIGGEPTLHDNILDIIEYISTHIMRHRVTLVTNGLKLASNKFTQQLKAAGLKTVYLSLNGFDEDDVYEKMDNLRCAKLKVAALSNCIENGINLSAGCIIVKKYNEHIIDKMRLYFHEHRKRISFEFRNIGDIGRNMIDEVENYTFTELKDLIKSKFDLSDDDLIENDEYGVFYHKDLYKVRVTNWEKLPTGFNSQTNRARGRMTEDFRVAPFFEHIKENEGFY